MPGLVIWTVFCVGVGALSASKEVRARDMVVNGSAASALLWSMGLGAWQTVAWVLGGHP